MFSCRRIITSILYGFSSIVGDLCSILIIKDIAFSEDHSHGDRILFSAGFCLSVVAHITANKISESKRPTVVPPPDSSNNNERKYNQDCELEQLSSNYHDGQVTIRIPNFQGDNNLHRVKYLNSCVPSSTRFILNIMPSMWFACGAYMLYMSIYDAEADNFDDIQTTIISGIASGSAFYLSLLPWKFFGIRDFIRDYRNRFIPLEYITAASLSALGVEKKRLFVGCWYSFFTGYNATHGLYNYLLPMILKKATNYEIDRSRNDENLQPNNDSVGRSIVVNDILNKLRDEEELIRQVKNEKAFYGIANFKGLLKIATGACFITSSLLVLYLCDNDEETQWRNMVVQVLSALGCTLFTYPIGLWLGSKIPEKYHKKIYLFSSYLIIPLANPGLSILEYFMVGGAGIVLGVSSTLENINIEFDIKRMQHYRSLFENLSKNHPWFFRVLFNVNISEKLQLVKFKKKMQWIRWVIHSLSFGLPVLILTKGSLWSFTVVNFITGFGYNFLYFAQKKFCPSIYFCDRLNNLSKFLFENSLSLSVAVMSLQLIYFDLRNSIEYTGATHFVGILKSVPLLILFTKYWFQLFEGRYFRYVPKREEVVCLINQLEKSINNIEFGVVVSNNSSVYLSKDLLGFIKYNVKKPPGEIEIVNAAVSKKELRSARNHSSRLFRLSSVKLFVDGSKRVSRPVVKKQCNLSTRSIVSLMPDAHEAGSEVMNDVLDVGQTYDGICVHNNLKVILFSTPGSNDPNSINEENKLLAQLQCEGCRHIFLSLCKKEDKLQIRDRFGNKRDEQLSHASIRVLYISRFLVGFSIPGPLRLCDDAANTMSSTSV